MKDEDRRLAGLIVISILLGLFSWLVANNAITIANIANQSIAFEVIVNNTNLAPNVAGHPFGTGERMSGNLYWTNISAIQLLVFSHASTASQNANIVLKINNTEVLNTALRPLVATEQTNTTISAIIPKGSNYSVLFLNYHHYEWREYPILSGRNGTLSINQTVINSSTNYVSNHTERNLSADNNMPITGVWFMILNINISKGTWLLHSSTTIESAANTAQRIVCRMSYGLRNLSSSEGSSNAMGAGIRGYVNLQTSFVDSVQTDTRINLTCATTSPNSIVKAHTGDFDIVNATFMSAIRLSED